ncbi:MAG: FIST N-terminal domain-containing protein [Cyanobacteria bacterium J06632_3]
MKLEQTRWTAEHGWKKDRHPKDIQSLGNTAQLVLLFGQRNALSDLTLTDTIKQAYPKAQILGCSTAGEICDIEVREDSLVATAIEFEHTKVVGHSLSIASAGNSYEAGKQLAQQLERDSLTHVFVLSDGLQVNGSELVRGLSQHLPESISITGGLSGDGADFQKTLVMWNNEPQTGDIVVIGLYGNRLKVGCGSWGGWDTFGVERLVTSSHQNVLYQLDGKSALDLYKKYLGDHAANLPASGLLFPLSQRTDTPETAVVRTILSVDEKQQSLTFAGDIPEGSYVRLMKANFDRLVDGAIEAAEKSLEGMGHAQPELAICISCVGRKLVLKQRIEEEIEGVRDVLGEGPVITGFYSYGEIAPFEAGTGCSLHNQTMTVTTFSEH